MTRPDDIAPLLAPRRQETLAFRQGVVRAWNLATGANTVEVDGTNVDDIAMLNTSEAVALAPGAVVGILRVHTTYFILGRITPPGDPAFASASLAFGGDTATGGNFGLTPTPTTFATAVIAKPSWADEALVWGYANAQIFNNSGVNESIAIGCDINGFGSGALSNYMPINELHTVNQANYRIIDLSATNQIEIEGRIWSEATNWPAHQANGLFVHTAAIFRSTP